MTVSVIWAQLIFMLQNNYKNIRMESGFVEVLGNDFCCVYSGLLDLGLEIVASVLEGCFVGK